MKITCECGKKIEYKFYPKNATIVYRYKREKEKDWIERWFMGEILDVSNCGYQYNWSCENCGRRFSKVIWERN